ncbi:biotin transporter BioY [Archaeoglobales archaeon]|nr:MAG: biotin transporter BioY [Archaeoglobales archaeon]
MVNNFKMVLACSMAVITAITAQIRFNIAFIPYTMQNFGVVFSGLLLGPIYGLISQLIYIGMIAIGIPAASGFGGGIAVLVGPTAGYIWSFPLTAFIAGLFRKMFWRNGSLKEKVVLWVGCCIAAIPVYLLGFVVFYYYATINAKLMSWSVKASQYFGFNLNPFWSVFVASVIIFIPQDFFVDHLIAVSVYAYVVDLLKQKGIEM